MGLKATVKRLFSKPRKTVRIGDTLPLVPPEMEAQIDRQIAGRRFIEYDRVNNNSDWGLAVGQSINNDLQADLPQLMARCAHAYATNPIFEGVCNTFCQDVVGRNGPNLQINSPDPKFNEEVEWAVRQVFATPDPAGRLGGVENMKMWVRLLLTAGSYINIFGTRRRQQTESTFAWRTIHPRRLSTPLQFVGDEEVAFGIRINADGAPVTYYIDQPRRFGVSELTGQNHRAYPAEVVQHRFFSVEPEQLTGYPMMTSTLKTVAEVRRLDGFTMDAAQSAAWADWWLKNADPSKVMDPDPIGSTTFAVQRGAVNVAPAGWEPVGGQSSQPSAEGIEYRHERLAEVGRPIGMPLLIVLLSVNDATFSSAQFSGCLYIDSIRGVQGYIERDTLNPIVEMVAIDLILSGRVRRPDWYECNWTHNVPPHANIEKFVGAIEAMVANGFISLADASALLGYDYEKVLAARKRCQDAAEELELPLPAVNAGTPPKPEPVVAADGATPAAPPKKKPAAAPKKPAKRGGERARSRVAG